MDMSIINIWWTLSEAPRKKQDPLEGVADLFIADFAASRGLRKVSRGDFCAIRLMDSTSTYDPEQARRGFVETYVVKTDPKADDIKPVTRLGYLFRKHILGYEELT